MVTLLPLKYKRGEFSLLDQTLLPQEFTYVPIPDVEAGWEAIRSMRVRGAPAIAITAGLALAAQAERERETLVKKTPAAVAELLSERLDSLRSARPTAVNLFIAIDAIQAMLKERLAAGGSSRDLIEMVILEAERMYDEDIVNNKAMGRLGAARLVKAAGKEKVSVLTHCNTGSLATAGYGTALGVIRALHEQGMLAHAYCTETRPYNQGSRLTALELVHEGIPATLITDSMAGALMQAGRVDAVVVGADRIVANGDTANKIGTYGLAVLGKFHSVPFFVAAPTETLDITLQEGTAIEIEQRNSHEVTHIRGVQIAPLDINVWNPAFDVTPASLIEAIITDVGVIEREGDRYEVAAFLAANKSSG